MKLVPFSEIIKEMKRGPFGSAIKKEHFVPSGFKVYEQQNAIYDDIRLGRYFIDKSKFEELEGFKVYPGDFLVSCSGTIGKITRVPDDAAQGVINQALLRIKIDENKIDSDFFLHLFRSEWIQEKFVSGAKGVAIKNFAGVKELKQILIPLFSLQEQRKIAKKIDSLFSEIDSATEELHKTKQRLELYKQSVLNAAIRGQLVPQDPNDEPASKLLERIRAEKEKLVKEKKLKKEKPLQPIDLSEVPFELPKGWVWARLGDVCFKITDGFHNTPVKNEVGVPYISAIHVKEDKIDWVSRDFVGKKDHEELFAKASPQKGEILIVNIGAGSGDAAIIDIDYQFSFKNVAILKFNQSEVCNHFLINYLHSVKKRNYIELTNGGLQPFLSLKILKEMLLPVPPKNEQVRIAKALNKTISESKPFTKETDEQLIKTSLLKQSILKSAFEGKLI